MDDKDNGHWMTGIKGSLDDRDNKGHWMIGITSVTG